MAGAFTHFIISDEAKANTDRLAKELRQVLNNYYYFLFLGSVSPDLPYLSVQGSINWADVMHCERTNSVFNAGFPRLKNSWNAKNESDRAKLAWLFGYVSHMVADATIHPVVAAIVGDYCDATKDRHRTCEMVQDSMIFMTKRDQDIKYAEFVEMLRFCEESPYFNDVIEFWKQLMIAGYPEKGGDPHPRFWFETYSSAIDIADGSSSSVCLFRHAGIGDGFIYKTVSELKTSTPQDCIDYYEKAKVPGGGVLDFDNILDRTVRNVIDAWNEIYSGLSAGAPPVQIVRSWYLDSGVDTESPTEEMTYWV